ncbi:MAG: hypothetical protein J5I98_23485 [Phaeodactylibacter sp.]|nr:hypothetical protein [Phaeodactylibacter sp.]
MHIQNGNYAYVKNRVWADHKWKIIAAIALTLALNFLALRLALKFLCNRNAKRKAVPKKLQ